MTALQIILIAILNDIPIISLAFDRVNIAMQPAKINAKERFGKGSLFGIVGVANSLILFYLMNNVLHLSWGVIQTMYFLKLTVSGHLLIYVAHTKKRWFRFFPSRQVIWATSITQILASILALTGFLMPSKLTFLEVAVVWAWAFFWMQVTELTKISPKDGIETEGSGSTESIVKETKNKTSDGIVDVSKSVASESIPQSLEKKTEIASRPTQKTETQELEKNEKKESETKTEESKDLEGKKVKIKIESPAKFKKL
jgi:H+-transporting ATPase